MHRITSNFILLLSCLIAAIAGHAVFLHQWSRDRFMAGINDGLSQMLPFKKLLYEQYTNGEFFYSFDFGLGAGTFSELSYYFSTSLVFILTVAVVFLLETFGIVASPDVLFWAHAAVFINTLRLALVIFAATKFFNYLGAAQVSSFVGAVIYGVSGMYFRHAVYWEFFADAFLWLPLLLFGVEKILREQRPGWFLAAVSISLFDNFYFSYINFLLTGIYLTVRFFFPLANSEIPRLKAVGMFLTTGLLGFGISAVSFIPAVYAYLNNHRPSFEQEIGWVDFSDNVLFTSRWIILPAIFMVFLFSASLYRIRLFRFFAILGVLGVILHFSPMVGSVFNGFSAPQYRWEYFISLAAGGGIAAGLSQIHTISRRQFALAAALAISSYIFAATIDSAFDPTSILTRWTTVFLLATILLVFAAILLKHRFYTWALVGFILVSQTVFTNIHQTEHILQAGKVEQVDKALITGADYDDSEIRGLLEEIRKHEHAGIYRIDWMEGVRNNTPIVQEFKGLSAYSSILNENLLYFYLYDLEIDMGRESVSRYATLGNRANLHSLLQGDYVIREKGDLDVPYGFVEIASSRNYVAFENIHPLPFARPASDVYQEHQLEGTHPLVREHAMLNGIILDGTQESLPAPEVAERTEHYKIAEADARYENGLLHVTSESGGLDLINEGPAFENGDLYVSFHLENIAPSIKLPYPLKVNGYETTRKANHSIYRTYVDDLTIRIPASETIQIRLPEGNYKLTDIHVFEESYELLKHKAEEESSLSKLQLDGSHVSMSYNNSDAAPYLAINIPYERGWSATVNGERTKVMKANYAFIGVPLQEGANLIELTYRPPFFKVSLIITILSLLLSVLLLRKNNNRIAS